MSFGGFDPFGKGGADAATDAARIQANAADQGIAEQRRQFEAIQALLAPFIGAGTGALPGVVSGSTAGGFDQRIAEILGTDTFRALLGERTRSVENHLSGVGLTRSGYGTEQAARIPTELALALEETLFGRQSGLVNMGQASAIGQANVGNDISSRIAQMMGQRGDALAQGVIGAQQANAASSQNVLETGMAVASIFFSDPRLKANMEPVGKIGPLTLYEWDWKPGVSKIVGRMSIGFSADEVEVHFPQHVVKLDGFKAINYEALTAELQAKYGSH